MLQTISSKWNEVKSSVYRNRSRPKPRIIQTPPTVRGGFGVERVLHRLLHARAEDHPAAKGRIFVRIGGCHAIRDCNINVSARNKGCYLPNPDPPPPSCTTVPDVPSGSTGATAGKGGRAAWEKQSNAHLSAQKKPTKARHSGIWCLSLPFQLKLEKTALVCLSCVSLASLSAPVLRWGISHEELKVQRCSRLGVQLDNQQGLRGEGEESSERHGRPNHVKKNTPNNISGGEWK